MAKKKAASRKSGRKTTKKAARKTTAKSRGVARKRTLRKQSASAKRAAKPARKSAARRVKKAARAPQRAAAVARPAARAAAPVAATRPKRPRRTKQALPPAARQAPAAVDMPRPSAPPPATLPSETLPHEVERPAPIEAELVDSGPLTPAPAGPGVGELAPDFTLPDERGQMHRLSDYRGQRVVLYFYPKDDTPGCTAEACGFRDRLGEFTDRNTVVIGVSPDSPASHANFVRKYGLTFPLLADEGHRVAEQYGVWGEKVRYGKRSMGINRTTFIIDPEGRIAHVFRNVHAEGHEQEVLAKL